MAIEEAGAMGRSMQDVLTRPGLFWDTDPTTIDLESHADYVIARVLAYGTPEEVALCTEHYGLRQVRNVLAHSREIPNERSAFWLRNLTFEQEVIGMHEEVLPANARTLLPQIARLVRDEGFLLCGGTAVALHLGHRYSVDLDFLSERPFDAVALRQRLSETLPSLEQAESTANTVHAVAGGTKLSFIQQRGLNLGHNGELDGVPIANLLTLTALKLNAVASRGTRRDFIDLYAIGASVPELYRLGKRALPQLSATHLLRSLSYFTDAETGPMPKMIAPWNWDEVKRYFDRGVHQTLREIGAGRGPLDSDYDP